MGAQKRVTSITLISLVLLSKKYGLTEYSMKQIVTLPKSKLILKYLEASDFL